jgi:CRISPR-associated protein Cas5t
MVNGIRVYREADGPIRWLAKDNRGLIGLPIWINRQTGQGTFQRFSWSNEFHEECWVTIPKLQAPVTKSKGKRSPRNS